MEFDSKIYREENILINVYDTCLSCVF